MKTAFFAAVRTGMAALSLPAVFAVQVVIDQTIGVPTTNQRLMNAVCTRDPAALRRALEDGAQINQLDEIGCTPLLYAAAAGDRATVSVLLDRGADINAYGQLGATPLMFAACLDRVDIVSLLLERGADPALRTSGGRLSALDFAVNSDAFGAADVLKRHEILQYRNSQDPALAARGGSTAH